MPVKGQTTVGLISLGCAKNLIDSEIMIGCLQKAGMVMTPEAELADVLIINTCSFIDQAKKSIDTILGAMEDRAQSRPRQKIVVAGCLSQRFRQELPSLMPEVDAFIGLDQITSVPELIRGLQAKDGAAEQENLVTAQPKFIPDYDTPRFRLTPSHTAYIKIAEGCNHPCSFCIIPKIRGRHSVPDPRSRGSRSGGARRIRRPRDQSTSRTRPTSAWIVGRTPVPILGAKSIPPRANPLPRCCALSTKSRAIWVRSAYTHPAHWSDELIETIATSRSVARYVDMPLQHISDRMLTAMRRETDGAYIRDLVKRMRAGIPGLTLRTTFIVGFPGESEEDFEELLGFIHEAKFERASVFNYSKEEGTWAEKFPGGIHHATRKRRWNEAMRALQGEFEAFNANQVGRTIRVLVEKPGQARSEMDAPEVDSTVFVPENLPVGQFADVTIRDWRGYDLVAE